mmetsp:Transcript_22502/g.76494  ORF Transcript_22502/g.76494 Transcript_22502/m.76494 type:complete len:212 (+) Transcript_22502:657-1292(+)
MFPPSAMRYGRTASRTISTLSTLSSSCSAGAAAAPPAPPPSNGLTTGSSPPPSARAAAAPPAPSSSPSASEVCRAMSSLQSSPSTAFSMASLRAFCSSVSPGTSSARFSPIALRSLSFFASCAARSAAVSSSPEPPPPRDAPASRSQSAAPASVLPGGGAPTACTQWLTSRSMCVRVAIALFAKTMTRTWAATSGPSLARCARQAVTTLRL